MRQPIGPFDGKHAFRDGFFLQPEIFRCCPFETIEIGVIESQPAAAVLVDQREGRTAHLVRVNTQPRCQTAHKGCFSRPELARQQQHCAGLKRSGERTS